MISTKTQNRLMKEYQLLKTSSPPNFVAEYKENDILEWHFCIFGLEDPQYAGGYYHGKIVFPKTYPEKPPSIIMITPSGRFRPQSRICLTMSDFHPESWTPVWRFETIVQGLISFMLSEEHSVGSIHEPAEHRAVLARQSLEWNLNNIADDFQTLFAGSFDKMKVKIPTPDPQPTEPVAPEERKAEPVVPEERKAEPEELKVEPANMKRARKVEPVSAALAKTKRARKVEPEEADPNLAKIKRTRKTAGLEEEKTASAGVGQAEKTALSLENFKAILKQEIQRRLEVFKLEMMVEIDRL